MNSNSHYFEETHCFACGYDGSADGNGCRRCGEREQRFYCTNCGESFDDASCEEEECEESYGYAMKRMRAVRTIENFIYRQMRNRYCSY